MLDQIEIKKMRVWTVLGALPVERLRRRPVTITVILRGDFQKAVGSDVLADAVDYARVRDAVVADVEASSFTLLECLAARIAETALSFDGVEETTVCVEKPHALVDCERVGVRLTRGRG